jgi:hypothetical protein
MLEIVRVVAVHPEANSVDVVVCRTSARICGVQVLHGWAGADHGVSGLVQPAEQDANSTAPWLADLDAKRAIYAVVAQLGMPVLLGFLHPQVGQLMFAERNRWTWRHPSDLYATVRDNADLELAHPSGTFLRIAAAAAHEDLSGKDYDKRWAIERNTGAAPWVALKVANAGGVHTTITIDPSGNVVVDHAGNLTWTTHGNAAITVDGTANIHVVGDVTVNADADLHLTVGGTITSQAALWTHSGDMNLTGTFSASVDVLANGTSGHHHTHGGVTSGGAHTAAPD